MQSRVRNIAGLFARVYRPRYIALNVAVAVAYYFLLTALVRYQNYGILLLNEPKALIYALVVSSSVLFTIGVYAIRNSYHAPTKAAAGAVGTAATLLTGIVAGCGCSTPILFSIVAVGFSVTEVSILQSFIERYDTLIISAILAINLLLILYYSNKVSKTCRIRQ